jgi:hypothetical protein
MGSHLFVEGEREKYAPFISQALSRLSIAVKNRMRLRAPAESVRGAPGNWWPPNRDLIIIKERARIRRIAALVSGAKHGGLKQSGSKL